MMAPFKYTKMTFRDLASIGLNNLLGIPKNIKRRYAL